MPRRCEPAKMIQTNDIDKNEKRTQAVNAPAIATLPIHFPVVDGVTPKLSFQAEIIRRHAGDESRTAMLVEQKELGIGPDITGIGRNEKREVADEVYTFFPTVSHEALPLAEQ